MSPLPLIVALFYCAWLARLQDRHWFACAGFARDWQALAARRNTLDECSEQAAYWETQIPRRLRAWYFARADAKKRAANIRAEG